MKYICRNCKHSDPLPVKFTDDSLRAQGKMGVERQKVTGQGKEARLKAIKGVVESKDYSEHIKAHGALSMSKKKTDTDGNYVVCSNPNHLKDVMGHKPQIVHKYYFQCTHFEKGGE